MDWKPVCRCGRFLAAALTVMSRLVAQDVADIFLYRTGTFQQVADAEPEPIPETPDESPFSLLAVMEMSGSFLSDPDNLLFVRAVTLQPPTGALRGMDFFDAFSGFVHFDTFTSATALESAFRAGSYQFTFGSFITGDETYRINVPDASLPTPPRILNFDAAQTVNADEAFTLQWTPASPEVGGARLQIYDTATGEQAYDSGPVIGPTTSADIPAGSLLHGSLYWAEITFTRLDVNDPNSAPSRSAGAVALTRIPLKTGSGGAGTPAITAISQDPNGSLRLVIECQPGIPLQLQTSGALGAPWQTMETTTPDTSPTTWIVDAVSLTNIAFLQVTQ